MPPNRKKDENFKNCDDCRSLIFSYHNASGASLPTQYVSTLVNVSVNDIAYDSARNQILASIPSAAGAGLGNTISHISLDGGLVASTYIGSEPGVLGLSDDSSTLYVGLNGSPLVRRYDVATRVAGMQFGLGPSDFLGAKYAEDIEVLPGSTSSIAVSRKYIGVSPRHAGVAIFDNGVMRPTTTPGHTGSNSIVFSDTAQIMYGLNNETTEFGLRTMSVTASGVQTTNVVNQAVGSFGRTIEFADGLIYASSGVVFDPSLGFAVGTFNAPYSYYGLSALTPDTANGVAYGFSGSSLTIFDLDTYVPLQSYALGSLNGSVNEILLTENGQLGLRTSTKQLFLLTPVPEPSSWAMMFAGIFCVGFAYKKRLKQ